MSAGFYARGDGWLHRLDTRVKVFLSLCLVVCCAIWGNWIFLAAVLVGIHVAFATDRTPWYAVGRCWAGLGPVLAIVGICLLFGLSGVGTDVVWQVGGWRVTLQALALNGAILLRIADIVLAVLLTLVTTSDEQWTRGLSALRIPYRIIARWLRALHEIPAVFVNARRSRLMLSARGASLGVTARIRAWVEAWQTQAERNDAVEQAMRTRGVFMDRHGARRTLANPARMRAADWGTLCLTLLALAGVIVMMAFGW